MVWQGIYTYMTPFGCIWGVFNIRTPGSCTILAGETSWDGVDPGGAALRVCSRQAPPIPSPKPVQEWQCRVCAAEHLIALVIRRCHLCCVSHFWAFIRRGLCLLPVVVVGCGRCLSFGALGLLLSRACLSFFCFGGSAPSVLLLFLLAAAVDFCPLMLVAAVGVSLLVPCGFCLPWGAFLLVVVSGVCCLALWAFWGFCPPWGVRLPWVAVVCVRCLSFGVLGLLLAWGVFRFFLFWWFCQFCHIFFCFCSCWRLQLIFVLWCWSLLLVFLFCCPVASAHLGVSFFWWSCLVFVVWRSGLPGASAGPGLSPFVFVVVIGVAFLGALVLVLALGCSFSSLGWLCCWLSLALWGFCPRWGVFFFLFVCFAPLLCLSSALWLWLAIVLCCWLLLLVFFFWRPVASARPGVSFFWWLCLVFVIWCSGFPGASAGPGLSRFVFVVVIGVSFLGLWGFCSHWGVRLLPLGGCVGVCPLALWSFCLLCCVSLPLGGCRWHGSYGHSAACADVWCCVLRFGVCLPSGLGRFVCLLLPCGAVFDFPSFFLFFFLSSFSVGWCVALWDFRLPGLPLLLCWLSSACFAVFLFPFGCCGGHLSFGANSLLVLSAQSIFSSLVWATWSWQGGLAMTLGLFYRSLSVDLPVEVCPRAAATAVSRHNNNSNNLK